MSELMIDIETLGTKPDSVITALGAVEFGPEKVKEDGGLYLTLPWQPQLDSGSSVTEGTIRFWLNQPDSARGAMMKQSKASDQVSLTGLDNLLSKTRILLNFIEPIMKPNSSRIWAKGPGFDLAILRHFFDRQGYDLPWKYWQECCVRTALISPEAQAVKPPAGQTKHHALDDAIFQAHQVRAFLFHIRRKTTKPGTRPEDDLLG